MADGAGVENLLAREGGLDQEKQQSPELSHPGSQLGGAWLRRSDSGTTRRFSKLKLKGWRSSLAEDEIGLL